MESSFRFVFACEIMNLCSDQRWSQHLIEAFISSILPHKIRSTSLFFIDLKMMFRVLFPFCCFESNENSANSVECVVVMGDFHRKNLQFTRSLEVIPISRHHIRLSRILAKFTDGILSVACAQFTVFPTFSHPGKHLKSVPFCAKFAIVIIFTVNDDAFFSILLFSFLCRCAPFDVMLCEKSTRFMLEIAFMSDAGKTSKTNWINRTGNLVNHCYNIFTDAVCSTQFNSFAFPLLSMEYFAWKQTFSQFSFAAWAIKWNSNYDERKKEANKISVTSVTASILRSPSKRNMEEEKKLHGEESSERKTLV